MTFDSRRGGRTVEGELAVFAMEEGIHVYRAAVRGLLGGGSPRLQGGKWGIVFFRKLPGGGDFPQAPLSVGGNTALRSGLVVSSLPAAQSVG